MPTNHNVHMLIRIDGDAGGAARLRARLAGKATKRRDADGKVIADNVLVDKGKPPRRGKP